MFEDRTYMKWISWIREAISCMDDSGNFLHLPEAGGLYDQDPFFMRIWQLVRIEYLAAKNDESFLKTVKAQHGKN